MERTLVWGHRGASGYAPENTMTAFEKAVELGADGIELDVQLTKDGELVVIHDETIDRVSGGSGWVKDFTYAKLIKHNFNRTHPEYEHAQIPTLEEVYALIKPTDLTINVEIKTGVVFYPEIEERVLDLTERMGLTERVIFSSFNHYSIQKVTQQIYYCANLEYFLLSTSSIYRLLILLFCPFISFMHMFGIFIILTN